MDIFGGYMCKNPQGNITKFNTDAQLKVIHRTGTQFAELINTQIQAFK